MSVNLGRKITGITVILGGVVPALNGHSITFCSMAIIGLFIYRSAWREENN